MSDNGVILDVRSISKHFGALKAVDKVNFQVKKGEIVGLIGPNGAGKTTITNLVTGELRKTEGEVHFKGINVSNMQPFQIARIDLTRTYQVVKPLQNMTVKENILVGSLFGRSDRENDLNSARKTTHHIMELVGL
ncbi:MAG TPA: ATP-binding cassette domain-containing protein, partial [Atribacterota bacterium]|nr:ATP-binding cassette domain-containing protein [Atribacterota bacterium]